MEKTSAETKRRKINHPSSRGCFSPTSSSSAEKARDTTSTSHMRVLVAQTNEMNARIQQAKNFAVAQAQQGLHCKF